MTDKLVVNKKSAATLRSLSQCMKWRNHKLLVKRLSLRINLHSLEKLRGEERGYFVIGNWTDIKKVSLVLPVAELVDHEILPSWQRLNKWFIFHVPLADTILFWLSRCLTSHQFWDMLEPGQNYFAFCSMEMLWSITKLFIRTKKHQNNCYVPSHYSLVLRQIRRTTEK